MKGQWIIKEVYFEDGFPKIIRDLKPETPDVPPWSGLTDEELESIWDADETDPEDTGSLYYAKLIIRQAEAKLREKNA